MKAERIADFIIVLMVMTVIAFFIFMFLWAGSDVECKNLGYNEGFVTMDGIVCRTWVDVPLGE